MQGRAWLLGVLWAETGLERGLVPQAPGALGQRLRRNLAHIVVVQALREPAHGQPASLFTCAHAARAMEALAQLQIPRQFTPWPWHAALHGALTQACCVQDSATAPIASPRSARQEGARRTTPATAEGAHAVTDELSRL